jgi:N-acetylglucosaminyldiphosphoundecaprenol N-acetyl-beta-D-mannosaminyltransferase
MDESSETPTRAGRPLRLLFLIAHPTIEGPLPKIAPLVVEGLRSDGFQVDVAGWSRRREGESSLDKVTGRAQDLGHVLAMLRQRPYDAVLVTTTHDRPALVRDVPLMLSARYLVPTMVLHFHGSMVDTLLEPGHRAFRTTSRWLAESADAVLLLSSEEVEKWRRVCPNGRFERVDNPFIPPPEAALPSLRAAGEPPTLLFAGRLIEAKGVFDLIEAFALVVADVPCRLIVAGSGDATAVAEAAERSGCADAVSVVGYLEHDDLTQAYRRAAAFVLPTYFGEGFPTVLSEAMAFGLPLVTTPIRGAADLLEDGVNAIFVPPRQPAALAAALKRLLLDRSLQERMAAANRARVAQFAPDKVVPRYAALLRGLAAAAREPLPETPEGDVPAPAARPPVGARVLDVPVTALGRADAAEWVVRWAAEATARVVCAVNVHMVMEAHDDPAYAAVVSRAEMAVADGRPVWWACRLLGDTGAEHLRGEDLLLAICAAAQRLGLPVGFYGSTDDTLSAAEAELRRRYPDLRVTLRLAPPFRRLDAAEERRTVAEIEASGARILFVALGCPKQERWMDEHRATLTCVMIGVGAAVDMLAGTVPAAPRAVQRFGLEWLYRLLKEPGRLWRRYARHNGRFVLLAARQIVTGRVRRRDS